MPEFQFPEGLIKGRVITQVAEMLYSLGPSTNTDLGELVGSHRAVISKVMRKLHAAQAVYIKEWTHPGNSNVLAPVWAWRTSERQRDAKRPKPLSRTEINVRWNARHATYRSVKQKAKRGTTANVWSGLL